ncbi:MFS transporter [Siphonobacter sp. SORGH_AS_1065]|uniref:MFS transporter n=1 Tax=Siphonobacter sp. SORGH_AS_1065 TaxID=3041795 RepID=UPI00277E9E17|nr:MFS transporter [Siphonobacter sp. SORGH_AS_1065]MDQ1089916.1 putative MFS family arabinose efflux permease [Siphonobacter sp. SORGH_AS_1065]
MNSSTLAIHTNKARFGTQAIFLVCGLGISSWAPMVPYVKDRLGLDESSIGLLLLFLGAGAILMMPVTGWLISKLGSRRVILGATVVMSTALPLLLLMNSPVTMALMLFLFGSGVGSVDVAMNAHGVQVQNLSDKPIMSSLHGLFSVGGLLGSLGIGFLIRSGLEPLWAAVAISCLLVILMLSQYKVLLDADTEQQVMARFTTPPSETFRSKVSWLHGQVLFLGALCFASFLSEGAMLDWGAIFLRDTKGVEESLAGIGYAAFSVAMAVMRLLGDGIVSRISSATVVIAGSLIGVAGFGLLIFSPWLVVTLAGFVLVGIGAANIVPVFFSEGGRLRDVPSSVAIPAITTMGYAGQLAGPAILGFLAQRTSLPTAFGFTGLLLFLVAVAYFVKSKKN